MRSKGFTLIELLVVIAIIGILTAILIPSLAKVKQIAQRLMCTGNLRQIGIALELYQNEYNSYGPFLGIDPTQFSGYLSQTPEQMVSSYLDKTWSVWTCPSDRNELREIWYLQPDPDLPVEMRKISYTWSEPLLQGFYPGHPDARGQPWEPLHYYNEFKGPILADGNRMLNVWDWQKALSAEYALNSLDQSHGEGEYHKVNLLFADMNIELITCNEKTLESLSPW